MKKFFLFFLPVIALLAGCATVNSIVSDPTGPAAIAALQGAYITAESAELVYLKSGATNPATVKTLESDRLAAYAALEPLVQASEATPPQTVTVAEMEGAQAVVTAMQNFETANKISTSTGAQ